MGHSNGKEHTGKREIPMKGTLYNDLKELNEVWDKMMFPYTVALRKAIKWINRLCKKY